MFEWMLYINMCQQKETCYWEHQMPFNPKRHLVFLEKLVKLKSAICLLLSQ